MKEVLLYLTKETTNKNDLYSFLEKENIIYTLVDDTNMNQSIKDLFTENNKQGNTSEKFSFNFVLFRNFEKEDIMNFVENTKKEEISFSHKAILTKNNQDWTLETLLLEIDEEHQFFKSWEKLHALLKEANDLNPEDYTLESYEPYKESFLKAYIFTKDPQKDRIHKLIIELESTREELKTRTK